ncbi:Hypothetical predicted protein, partial [Paramuricea clavata]
KAGQYGQFSYELFEEFQVLYSVEAEVSTLDNVYKHIETKYRLVKQQQEVIIDKILEGKVSDSEEAEKILESNKKIGTQVKTHYLNCTKSFAEYQKKCSLNKSSEHKSDSIQAMTFAVTKMAEALTSTKTDKTSSLEKLSVPVWDGKRKSYLTWNVMRYAIKIMGFANDMEENGCSVADSNESPFIMSQLLSKLESRDNADFGRDI